MHHKAAMISLSRRDGLYVVTNEFTLMKNKRTYMGHSEVLFPEVVRYTCKLNDVTIYPKLHVCGVKEHV